MEYVLYRTPAAEAHVKARSVSLFPPTSASGGGADAWERLDGWEQETRRVHSEPEEAKWVQLPQGEEEWDPTLAEWAEEEAAELPDDADAPVEVEFASTGAQTEFFPDWDPRRFVLKGGKTRQDFAGRGGPWPPGKEGPGPGRKEGRKGKGSKTTPPKRFTLDPEWRREELMRKTVEGRAARTAVAETLGRVLAEEEARPLRKSVRATVADTVRSALERDVLGTRRRAAEQTVTNVVGEVLAKGASGVRAGGGREGAGVEAQGREAARATVANAVGLALAEDARRERMLRKGVGGPAPSQPFVERAEELERREGTLREEDGGASPVMIAQVSPRAAEGGSPKTPTFGITTAAVPAPSPSPPVGVGTRMEDIDLASATSQKSSLSRFPGSAVRGSAGVGTNTAPPSSSEPPPPARPVDPPGAPPSAQEQVPRLHEHEGRAPLLHEDEHEAILRPGPEQRLRAMGYTRARPDDTEEDVGPR